MFLGDLKITLSVLLTSLGKVRHVAPLQGASLAPENFGSEVMVTSLLARSSAPLLALLRRYLALQQLGILSVFLDTDTALAMPSVS